VCTQLGGTPAEQAGQALKGAYLGWDKAEACHSQLRLLLEVNQGDEHLFEKGVAPTAHVLLHVLGNARHLTVASSSSSSSIGSDSMQTAEFVCPKVGRLCQQAAHSP
jgi:hypothetical protein